MEMQAAYNLLHESSKVQTTENMDFTICTETGQINIDSPHNVNKRLWEFNVSDFAEIKNVLDQNDFVVVLKDGARIFRELAMPKEGTVYGRKIRYYAVRHEDLKKEDPAVIKTEKPVEFAKYDRSVINVTISGVVGSGKSTVAGAVLKSLKEQGFNVTLEEKDIDFPDEEKLIAHADKNVAHIANEKTIKLSVIQLANEPIIKS